MFGGLTVFFFALTSIVVRGLTRYDNNTCFDKDVTREYVCCSNYEEINDECISEYQRNECKLGFRSRKGNSCEPCAFHLYGEGCSYKCMCNVTQGCDKVKGCVEKYSETTSLLTKTTNIAKAISPEGSVTKVYDDEIVTTLREEEQSNVLSKTEVLILFCGALSGIIVLLGILGISNCLMKRLRISRSKREKTIEEEVDEADANVTQESFELHETLYESIDDSNLDSILLPITSSSNLEKDYDSSSSESITQCNEDRAGYLHPFIIDGTKESSDHTDELRQNAMPSTIKPYCEVGQSLNSPYPQYESNASGYEIPVDCTYDRASYLHRNNTLVDNTSYCHISEVDKSIPLSEKPIVKVLDETIILKTKEINGLEKE